MVHTEEIAAINAPEVNADQKRDVSLSPITSLGGLPEDGYGEEELQTLMGASLLLGFIFMLFVDQVGGGSHSHSSPSGQLLY